MADIELVIKIPEEDYERFKTYQNREHVDGMISVNVIADGIPLPTGHGRILDEKDILDTENNSGGWYDLVDMPEYIAGVKAIIEAESDVNNG